MQQRTRQRARAHAPAYRPVWLRFALALCATLLAASHLSAITHMAFVVHARCAEHGELVHAADGASHGGAREQLDARRPALAPAPANATPADVPPSDEHDHCPLGTAPPGETAVAEAAHRHVPPPSELPRPSPALPAPRARALVPPPPPIALLLLSPKSSPPA